MSSKSHFFRQSAGGFADGLTHHYSFEETAGTTTFDAVGNIDGSTSLVTFNQPGQVNKSFYSAISSAYIKFNSDLGITGYPFSVKIWVDITTHSYTSVIGSYTSSFYTGFDISRLADGRVYIRFGTGLGTGSNNTRDHISSNVCLSTGQNQITMVVHSFGVFDLYIDGVIQPMNTPIYNGAFMEFNAASYALRYPNKHDELSIFNTALTQQEVVDIYDIESAGNSIL